MNLIIQQMGNLPSLFSNYNCYKGKDIKSKITIQIESHYTKAF